MSALGTILFLANFTVFLTVGHVFMIRLREAKGSLRLAKICAAMTTFSAAAAFAMLIVSQLIYDPGTQNLPVKQLYVSSNLFAMLVMAFLASFAILSAYAGGRRKLVLALVFIVALIPTAYLTLTYNDIVVKPPQTDVPESYELEIPSLSFILFALCGIPLGVVPLLAFSRMLVMARRRGDKPLSHSVAMMFSAVLLNEVAFLVFTFGAGVLRLFALAAWIPIVLFLLFAVLRITRPAKTAV